MSGLVKGFVYVDANTNGVMDSNDWAIADAKITLTQVGSSDSLKIAFSKTDGSYSFNTTGLLDNSYTISMVTPNSLSGQDKGEWRTLLNEVEKDVSEKGTPGLNTYVGIRLGNGYTGTNYNFAEAAYPTSLISKRLLLSSNPGFSHTGDITPVPEPGSLVLLAIAGLVIGGLTWRRRRHGR